MESQGDSRLWPNSGQIPSQAPSQGPPVVPTQFTYQCPSQFSQQIGVQFPAQATSPMNTPLASQFTTQTNNTTGTAGTSRQEKANAPKAKWDDRTTEMFIRLCVSETTNGNRPGSHFNRLGWENLIHRFQQASGIKYTKIQLKNKWDTMKKEWGVWNKLVRNETGLGWDPVKGTVVASPDWWERKLLVTPEAAKYRTKGPFMIYEQEILFSDVVANGSRAWAPRSGIMSQHLQADLLNNIDEESTHIGTEDEYEAENDEDRVNEDYVHTLPIPSTTPLSAPLRRASTIPPRIKGKKARKVITAQQVVKCLQTMTTKLDTINPNGCSCSKKPVDTSLDECLEILNNMEGVEEGDKVWIYATRLFLKSSVRNLFLKIKKDHVRLLWLEEQFQRDIFKRGGGGLLLLPLIQALVGCRTKTTPRLPLNNYVDHLCVLRSIYLIAPVLLASVY